MGLIRRKGRFPAIKKKIFSYIYPLFAYHATEDSKVFDTLLIGVFALEFSSISGDFLTNASLLIVDLKLPNVFKLYLLPPKEVLTIVKIKQTTTDNRKKAFEY